MTGLVLEPAYGAGAAPTGFTTAESPVRTPDAAFASGLPLAPARGAGAAGKRAIDIAFSALSLLALLPALLAVAALIRLESPGPILFRQRRTGLGGRPIEVWKFRSMRHGAGDAGGARQTSRRDERVTRVGRVIRRLSIDELPQLFNVLTGDMSLVGPRPHALQTTVGGVPLAEACPSYMLRYGVKPGLTGLAQVRGYRGPLDSRAKLRGRVRYDLLYIARWSLLLDLRIIALTALTVAFDRHAY